MVVRVSVPGRPVVLRDLGPAVGIRHEYARMRETLDTARPSEALRLAWLHSRAPFSASVEVRR